MKKVHSQPTLSNINYPEKSGWTWFGQLNSLKSRIEASQARKPRPRTAVSAPALYSTHPSWLPALDQFSHWYIPFCGKLSLNIYLLLVLCLRWDFARLIPALLLIIIPLTPACVGHCLSPCILTVPASSAMQITLRDQVLLKCSTTELSLSSCFILPCVPCFCISVFNFIQLILWSSTTLHYFLSG